MPGRQAPRDTGGGCIKLRWAGFHLKPLKPLQGAGAALSPTAMTKPTGAQRRSVPGVPQLGRAQRLSWAARSYPALK